MKITKRWSLLPVALVALAMAAPAAAGASQLESSPGVLAPVGTNITMKGYEVTFNTSWLGRLGCSRLDLKQKLTRNSGGFVEGAGVLENPFQENCLNGTKSLTVSNAIVNSLTTSTSEKGTLGLTFDLQIGSELHCHYVGASLPFTYRHGDHGINFTSAKTLVSSPASCGTALLSGYFELLIGRTPVILN
jgi:hypothetical protein